MEDGCCFTGHRSVPEEVSGRLREKLREHIAYLHEEKKIRAFYAGGCVGFDTMAAQETLEYRAAHPDVRLVIVIPYRNQSSSWTDDDRREYERIKAFATEVVCLAEHYFRGCTHQRNRYMVQRSFVCVCYLTKEKGGTASTVKYALRNGLFIRNLAVEI
ncbi:MAG: DUF1273 family protein [Oscillibacter sp.]|nr:DUF1273 family protein [Oscillibacter sp.]